MKQRWEINAKSTTERVMQRTSNKHKGDETMNGAEHIYIYIYVCVRENFKQRLNTQSV